MAVDALRTMGLLVPADECNPRWFDECRAKNQKHGNPGHPRQCHIDEMVKNQSPRLKSRRVTEFRWFQKRLLALEEAFEDVSPWSVGAWWHDKRKGRDVATFWATVCGFLCALVALLLAGVSALVATLQANEANRYAQTANSLAVLANEYASNASTDAAKTAEAITTFTTIHIAGTTNFIGSSVNQLNNGACLSLVGSCNMPAEELVAVPAPGPALPSILATETGSRPLPRAIPVSQTSDVGTSTAAAREKQGME